MRRYNSHSVSISEEVIDEETVEKQVLQILWNATIDDNLATLGFAYGYSYG